MSMSFILFKLVIDLSPTTVYTANYNLNIAFYESRNIFVGKLYYLQHTFCFKKKIVNILTCLYHCFLSYACGV